MKGRFPNLLVIGAMKAGTTSLHSYLDQHPDIYMSKPKELHYYADVHYKKWTKEQYMNFFQSDAKIVGSSPQSYTKCHNKYYQNIPERIYRDTPDVKMIYIVRDPIERYKSHILESYHCDPKRDIEYSKEIDNYLKTSMYGMQLEEFLKYFKIEQFHILSLEELKKNPLNEMNSIFTFLELKSMDDPKVFAVAKNAAESKKIPLGIKSSFLYRAGNRIIPELTKSIASFYANVFFKYQLTKPQLTNQELKELRDKLKSDIEKFRNLSGKSFSHWSI